MQMNILQTAGPESSNCVTYMHSLIQDMDLTKSKPRFMETVLVPRRIYDTFTSCRHHLCVLHLPDTNWFNGMLLMQLIPLETVFQPQTN